MSNWLVVLSTMDGKEDVKGGSAYKSIAAKIFAEEQDKAFIGVLELFDPSGRIVLHIVKK